MILSHFQTRPLVGKNALSTMPLSTDLGRSYVQIYKTKSGWELQNGEILTYSQVQAINQDENSCYVLRDGKLEKVGLYSERTNRYYSLMPTETAPTMLISGIPMHRIKGITPVEDTDQKIKALGKPYGTILDTSTGLGYTAIQAAKSASKVITVEFDPIVLSICRLNPWSGELFGNPKIFQLIGDSWDIVNIFPEGSFNAIIHDPPTLTLAGHLYSQSIYDNFYRILKDNGHLFHYIGNPDSRSGSSTSRGVVKRLQRAGFRVIPKPQAYGVVARK
ncbi:MAG: spermine synthase [Chloroflexota bacterium]|nr:spermine synthase [Chloroflexota bacterium]